MAGDMAEAICLLLFLGRPDVCSRCQDQTINVDVKCMLYAVSHGGLVPAGKRHNLHGHYPFDHLAAHGTGLTRDGSPL